MNPIPGQSCRFCESSDGMSEHTVAEMMFGTGEHFAYHRCKHCGSMENREIPTDMSRHYPDGYYSFSTDPSLRNRVKQIAHRLRARHALWKRGGWPGRLLYHRFPDPMLASLGMLGLNTSARILDVGCGSGSMLYTLGELGFARVLGVDPFAPQDILFPHGAEIRKAGLGDVQETFDLVMFHHSFEHMEHPENVLAHGLRVLPPGGICLINTPNPVSEAWDTYGERWVQLDAPRHLFLPSPQGLEALATRIGFEVTNIRWNSTAFQFWGSEQYRMGIPLNDARSHAVNPASSPFSRQQIREWESMARVLNTNGRGDQYSICLRKPLR
ncbi:MAG: class I SAM-dependent methyltransferase [Bacteroidia bacterium]|nr:class I SAM-dependent methyltransferase [Bacteroidia bacterium]